MSNLTQKHFILFLIARGLGLLADEMFVFALPVALYISTGEVQWSGLAFIGLWTTRIVATPFLGSISDQYEVRQQYVILDACRILLCLSIMALLNSPWALLVLFGFINLLNGHAYLLLEKTVASVATDANRSQLQARLQTIEQIAHVAAPAGAGALLYYGGLSAVTLVALAAFVISLTLIFFGFKISTNPKRNAALEPIKTIVKGANIILSKPELTEITGTAMLSNFVEGVARALMPFFFLNVFARGEEQIGVFFSITAGASILVLGFLAARKDLKISQTMARVMAGTMTVTAVLMPAAGDFYVYCGLYLTYVVLRCIYIVHFRSERTRIVSTEDLGNVIGVSVALLSLPLLLAGGFVSGLGSILSASIIQWIAAIFGFSILVLLTFFSFKPRIENEKT